MKTLNKLGLLLISILFVIVMTNSNVIAAKLNDIYSKTIAISDDNTDTVSPTYQKHFESSSSNVIRGRF